MDTKTAQRIPAQQQIPWTQMGTMQAMAQLVLMPWKTAPTCNMYHIASGILRTDIYHHISYLFIFIWFYMQALQPASDFYSIPCPVARSNFTTIPGRPQVTRPFGSCRCCSPHKTRHKCCMFHVEVASNELVEPCNAWKMFCHVFLLHQGACDLGPFVIEGVNWLTD